MKKKNQQKKCVHFWARYIWHIRYWSFIIIIYFCTLYFPFFFEDKYYNKLEKKRVHFSALYIWHIRYARAGQVLSESWHKLASKFLHYTEIKSADILTPETGILYWKNITEWLEEHHWNWKNITGPGTSQDLYRN